ncbi:MAG: cupin domain-containing protein [Chlamydiales bacterium]|nr:cupin domain-containing protein [Chlamydiales bacterium]NCF71568.1 cupin domain-containing protein [Chlamydiales bacterium]
MSIAKSKKVIDKPWGHEELLELNQRYMFKKLFMKQGHCCSLQYHEKKQETVYLLEGKLKLYLGNSADDLEIIHMLPGDSITITPGQIHRMEAAEDAYYLESSTPEIDDVVRIEDNYNRV